jgi:hypothetical protein
MNFDDQVEMLTGITISGSGTVPTETQLTQMLLDGVIDVTQKHLAIKPHDAPLFARSTSTSDSQGGLGTNIGRLISVVRESGTNDDWRGCREVTLDVQSRVTDASSIHYASKFNPAFLRGGDGAVLVYPAPAGGGVDSYKVYYVNETPVNSSDASLAYNHSDLNYFPKDKVYLVILFASIRSLEAAIASTSGANSDITTALTAINTNIDSAVDEIVLANAEANEIAAQVDSASGSSDFPVAFTGLRNAINNFRAHESADGAVLFGDETQYQSGIGMTHVKDALDKAQNLIDGATMSGDTEPESAQFWLNDEDTEMVGATIQTAQTEIQRAQAHLAEWSAAAQTLSAEIGGWSGEVQARAAFTSAKSQAVQAYIGTAQSYLQGAQSFIAESQAIRQELAAQFQQQSQLIQNFRQQYTEAFLIEAPKQQAAGGR